ncbi:hypothetical protein BDZ89DRAFT_1011452 [Hymenopellis radicata]|nr:hypothetical protein BDZ89DRAFT_1011452 [Hymenopellis radicata]
MNLTTNWLCRPHSCRWPARLWRQQSSPKISFKRGCRLYATHRDSFTGTSSDLFQTLDTTRRRASQHDTAGPFPIGISQSFGGERPTKWSELSLGGKMKRTTARTSNTIVILFGAGLSVVLIYCLTTELWSSNSPTVLHNEACERVRKSPQIAKFLHGPLTFHNTAIQTSSERPKSRMGSHQISSEVVVDSNGRRHMYLNFFIKGHLPGATSSSDSYYESITSWIEGKASRLPAMSMESITTWTKDQSTHLSQQFRQVFKYLIGAPSPLPQNVSTPTHIENAQKEEGKAWQVAGIFSSLRRTKSNPEPPEGQVFTDGEGHAELVMNSEGNYVFRFLFVDIPNSQDPRRVRVFVEKPRGTGE